MSDGEILQAFGVMVADTSHSGEDGLLDPTQNVSLTSLKRNREAGKVVTLPFRATWLGYLLSSP